MGIGFVLLIWTIVGAFVAFFWSPVLQFFAVPMTRGARDNQRIISEARKFPFFCLVWIAVVFIFQAEINGIFLCRDPGLGDGFWCPLPNGYVISMIDTTERAALYNPETGRGESFHGDEKDSIADVTSLQISGTKVLGCTDYGHYFIMDTNKDVCTKYKSLEKLSVAATKLGVTLKLEPTSEIYSRYRFCWFDILVALVLIGVPGRYLSDIVKEVRRIRRTAWA